MSFIVVGEGRPARTLLELMVAEPGATIEALVVDDPAHNALAEFARRHRFPVVDKRHFTAGCQSLADERQCRWLINVNSTLIIPADVLERFGRNSLNFHPGLLPQYAGLHTHQWAIRNGEREFGVTVHRMERGIDTGAIVGQAHFLISPDDTGLSLYSRCLSVGIKLLSRIVKQIIRGDTLTDVPQDLSKRRFYRHRDALDGRIDWEWTASGVINFVRAGNYEPFASPTYVARLDAVPGFDIEVLRASRERASDALPGMVIEASAAGPLVVCGDGAAIRIVKARCDRQLMSAEKWHSYVSHLHDSRLLGRGEERDSRDAAPLR